MTDRLSYKNMLQELCVQRGLSIPLYTTVITGGSGHNPVFRTVLKVGSKEYTVSDNGTRRDVESKAAKNALEDMSPSSRTPALLQPGRSPMPGRSPQVQLQHVRSPPPLHIGRHSTISGSIIPTTIVLVDLDNCDIPLAIVQSSNALFYIFVTKNSAKNFTQYRGIDNCVVMPAPTTVRDASDTLMIYEARALRDRFPEARFIIFTRDHFGETLSLLTHGHFICHIKDLEDILPDP